MIIRRGYCLLTRVRREGVRLEPSALIGVGRVWRVVRRAAANSRRTFRVKSPRSEVRRGLLSKHGRLERSPTGAPLGNQRLDAEREATPLLLRGHVLGLGVLRLLLGMHDSGVLGWRARRCVHRQARRRAHAPPGGPLKGAMKSAMRSRTDVCLLSKPRTL